MADKKNYGIQALRGLACIMVVMSHYIGAYQFGENSFFYILSKTPIRIMWDGTVAIDIFFVLSGYYFYKKRDNNNYFGIIWKRLLRLYPAYFGALLLGIFGRITSWRGVDVKGTEWVNSQWQSPLTIVEIIKGIIFFPTFDATAVNGPLWTMKIELISIFVLPLFCYMCNKMSGILILVITMIVARFFQGATYFNFLMYIPMYVTGMVAKKYSDEKVDGIGIKKWMLIGGLLLEYRWLSTFFGIKSYAYIEHVVTAVGAAILIFCLNKNNNRKSILSIIGDYSFFIYLVHFVVMLWLRFVWDDYNYYFYLTICLIGTGILAALFKELFSNPFFRTKEGIIGRKPRMNG